MILLKYDKGSLLIHGNIGTPYGQWDPRVGCFRAMALYYPQILSYLKRSRLSYRDKAANPLPIATLKSEVKLRSYQKGALDAWFAAGKRGVIVLPTGAGKTFVAIKAIEKLNTSTLVIVPTLDLLDQWRQQLGSLFEVEVGAFGGGEDTLRAITVSTYDSAYIRAEQLGNKFMFIIFDEVHHLPAPSYTQIAEMYIAPHRMGLTATYEREDGGHFNLPKLIGGPVYQLGVDALAGKHLSPFTHEKILVDLVPEEMELYKKDYGVFKRFLSKRGISLRSYEDFKR
ncbi:MAG: DEAD/DEAH box helicase family protein, partial [Candidatus Hodarchaeota archaeon]